MLICWVRKGYIMTDKEIEILDPKEGETMIQISSVLSHPSIRIGIIVKCKDGFYSPERSSRLARVIGDGLIQYANKAEGLPNTIDKEREHYQEADGDSWKPVD